MNVVTPFIDRRLKQNVGMLVEYLENSTFTVCHGEKRITSVSGDGGHDGGDGSHGDRWRSEE